jgi:hypothetical protein
MPSPTLAAPALLSWWVVSTLRLDLYLVGIDHNQITWSAGVYGSASLPVQKPPVFQQGGLIRLPHSAANVSASSSSCGAGHEEQDKRCCC